MGLRNKCLQIVCFLQCAFPFYFLNPMRRTCRIVEFAIEYREIVNNDYIPFKKN